MYINREDFVAWMERIMDRFDMQDKKIDLLLKVSAKTLQRYRKKGILPYLTLDGRCYYRESDVHQLIRERTD